MEVWHESLKKTAIYLGVLLQLGFLSALAESGIKSSIAVYNLNVCNFAPYEIKAYWATQSTGGLFHSRNTLVKPGQCELVERYSQNLYSSEPKVVLYAEPVLYNENLRYLNGKNWYLEYWKGMTRSYGGGYDGTPLCVPAQERGDTRIAHEERRCGVGESLKVFTKPISFSKESEVIYEADWGIADHALCNQLTDLDCSSASLDELRYWAFDLSQVIRRLSFYENPPRTLIPLIPTDVGFKIDDFNGPFDQGFKVKSALAKTPFGTPISLRPGDIVLSYDGIPVYGRDIVELVYHSAFKGYKTPHEVVYSREGQLYKTQIGLFFDRRLYGNVFLDSNRACAHPIRASIVAAVQEFSFYKQNTVTCLIDSISQDVSHYYNFDSCKFERDQILGAFKQFCPQDSYIGEMAGGVGFIGRSLIEKTLLSAVPQLKGKRIYQKAFRAAILEGAEESIRTLYTMPPGSTSEQVMEAMIARGKLQGLIGVGFQTVPVLTTISVAPIVYKNYSGL